MANHKISGFESKLGLHSINRQDDLQQIILTMSQQARRRILIFSHHLEHLLFDNDALYEAIKLLAIKSRYTYVQIIVQDSHPMTRKGHRLLQLAQRIPSHISIKVTAKEHQKIFQTFMLFDDKAYIIHYHPERYDAISDFHNPLKSRQLYEQFDELWERGIIDNSLRRLSL